MRSRDELGIEPHCPVCGAGGKRWVRLPGALLYRCRVCDHCFTDVRSIGRTEPYGSGLPQDHKNWFENPNVALFSLLRTDIARREAKVCWTWAAGTALS